MLWVVLAVVIACCCVALRIKFFDPLKKFEPLSHEELTLLSFVEIDFAPSYMKYIRTMEMDVELQAYIKNDKQLLEMTNTYLQLQFARAEEDKKKKWVDDFNTDHRGKLLDHNAKLILGRISAVRKFIVFK